MCSTGSPLTFKSYTVMFSMASESNNASLPVLTMEWQIYVNMNLPQCFNLVVRSVCFQPRCGEHCRPLTPPNLAWYNRMSSGLFSGALYFPWAFIPSRGWSAVRQNTLYILISSRHHIFSHSLIFEMYVCLCSYGVKAVGPVRWKHFLGHFRSPLNSTTSDRSVWGDVYPIKPSHGGVQISYHLSWMSHA